MALNPAMENIFQFSGSFTPGRSIRLLLGGNLSDQILEWISYVRQHGAVPLTIESDLFSVQLALTETVRFGKITIIKGMPLPSSPHPTVQEDESRSQFLNDLGKSVSHDLRAPLRHINLMAQRILHPSMEVPDNLRPDLKLITESASEALSRASAVAEILKEEARAIVSEELNLENIADIIAGEFTYTLQDRQGAISIGSLPAIQADRHKTEFIFRELLKNAITHVPEGTAPQISVNAISSQEGTEIVFTDNGIGLPAGSDTRLFLFMNQIHAELGDIPAGMGLGLMRCHRAAQRMNMELVSGKQPTSGATFRLKIPAHLIHS